VTRESSDTPVACSLSDREFRDREATLLAEFRSAVTTTRELPDGYVFRLPGDKRLIALVTELIAAERECCPFLAFTLIFASNMGPIDVFVTGPVGAKEFAGTILVEPAGA
jgi:hypothetical protein